MNRRHIFISGYAALLMTVIVTAIITTLIVSYGILTYSTTRQTSNIINAAQTFYASEAGVEDGLWRYFSYNYGSIGNPDPTCGADYYLLVGLTTGKACVNVNTVGVVTIQSKGDAGGRNRTMNVQLDGTSVYTFAAFAGDGGLEMAATATIHCVPVGSGCLGDSQAGDKGRVQVNGNLLGNSAEDQPSDALIVGNTYVTGKVDIRPSERKEHNLALNPDLTPVVEDKYICLGDPTAPTGPNDDCKYGKADKAIVQKVNIHTIPGSNYIGRISMRIGYRGDPNNLPEVYMYPAKWNGTEPVVMGQKIRLGSLNPTSPLPTGTCGGFTWKDFATYPLLDPADPASGNCKVQLQGQDAPPTWVSFNMMASDGQLPRGPSGAPPTDPGQDVMWIILQSENTPPSGNYWKIYFDTDPNLQSPWGHAGGWGGKSEGGTQLCDYTTEKCILNSIGRALCAPNFPNCTNNPLPQPDSPSSGQYLTDFDFRVYYLGAFEAYDNFYNHSVRVVGELHADEAYGAYVKGGTSNDSIGFVGRRFASLFWRNRAGRAILNGYSFVQQLDNCDIGNASGPEHTGYNLESQGSFPFSCDSDVYNFSGSNNPNTRVAGRRHQISPYPTAAWYINPYYESPNDDSSYDVRYDRSETTICGGVTGGAKFTPYCFGLLARFSAGASSGCNYNDTTRGTAYIKNYPASSLPYNFCYYNNTNPSSDIAKVDESAFKSYLKAPPFNFSDDEITNGDYLPKAPAARPLPIFPAGSWKTYIIQNSAEEQLGSVDPQTLDGCVANGDLLYDSGLQDGSVLDTDNTDGGFTFGSSRAYFLKQPHCFKDDLIVRDGASVELGYDASAGYGANLYVGKNLRIVDGAGGIEQIFMRGSGSYAWPEKRAAVVVVEGVVDVDYNTQIKGGVASNSQFIIVASLSSNMGSQKPLKSDGTNWSVGDAITRGDANYGDEAAVYSASSQSSGATVVYFAENGSVVLPDSKGSGPKNALQVVARKIVMGLYAEISYRYGLNNLLILGGPAFAYTVGTYSEIE